MRIFSILHTSYLIPHTSYLIPHTSYLIPHTSCVRVCVRRQPTVTTGTTRRWQQVTRTCAAEGHGRHGLVPLKDTDVYADVCGCRACARATNGHRGTTNGHRGIDTVRHRHATLKAGRCHASLGIIKFGRKLRRAGAGCTTDGCTLCLRDLFFFSVWTVNE